MNRESEYLLLLGPELFERGRSHAGLFEHLRLVLVLGRGVRRGVLQGHRLGTSRSATRAVDQSSSGDHRDERRFTRDGRIETPGRSPDLHEDLLNGILRLGRVGAGASGQRPDESAEAVHHLVDGTGLLAGDALEDGRRLGCDIR